MMRYALGRGLTENIGDVISCIFDFFMHQLKPGAQSHLQFSLISGYFWVLFVFLWWTELGFALVRFLLLFKTRHTCLCIYIVIIWELVSGWFNAPVPQSPDRLGLLCVVFTCFPCPCVGFIHMHVILFNKVNLYWPEVKMQVCARVYVFLCNEQVTCLVCTMTLHLSLKIFSAWVHQWIATSFTCPFSILAD